MRYTLKDLKEGKVILQNDGGKKSSLILNKVFDAKINVKQERAGMMYYFFCKKENTWGGCDNPDISDQNNWPLMADGSRKLPDWLKGHKSAFHRFGVDNLPIQRAVFFKLKEKLK